MRRCVSAVSAQAAITGLEGLELKNHKLILSIENQSPQTISFINESSAKISKQINTAEVKNGRYQFATKIIAVKSGSFTINGNLTDAGTGNDCLDKYIACMQNIETQKENAIKACNSAGGSSSAECIAKVEKWADEAKKACLDEFNKCSKK